jgi:hypothetical protein
MITLDAATFMVAWATGMGAFLALTGRRREVGIGYGWTIRGTTGVLFAGAVVVGLRYEPNAVRDVAAALALITTVGVTFVSWQRRGAGVALQRERSQARSERVAQMSGIEKDEQVFDESVEVLLFLVPVGMVSVFNGTIDDAYGGMLGWFWAASAITTIVLVGVTRAALKERQYAAVMAATGLLYLAILTAFGTDLVARALLSGA